MSQIIEDHPEVKNIILKAEAEIKAITGCEIRIAIDAFEMQANNKDLLKMIICVYYDTTWERIISRSRPRELSDAMFIYMNIARTILKDTLRDIGKECGGRDHATVINGLRQIENYRKIKDRACYDMSVIKEKFIKKMML